MRRLKRKADSSLHGCLCVFYHHPAFVARHFVGKRSRRTFTPASCLRGRCAWGGVLCPGGGSGYCLGCAAIARFARLVLLAAGLLACFALCCVSAWFLLVTTRHPFWFVFVPAEGNRFALGTGGIRWSLLVGGLGPVLSIPKLCFKPFRRLSAVGFVLGWHREPHLITTLQAPFSIGYCRTHGRNHRGWTSCGDR